jgi:hypothetical protein
MLSSRQEEIIRNARETLAGKHERRATSSSSREPEIVHKRRDDAAVVERTAASSGSTQSWADWVEDCIQTRLMEAAEEMGKVTGEWLEEIRREQALLRREITQLREQVALERGLKALREEVEAAKNDVPKLPQITQRLEEGQAQLLGKVERMREKLSKVRVDQSVADSKLKELARETRKRATSFEMKFERTVASFTAEMHPAAAATLREFADASLKGSPHERDKIWVFPDSAVDAAS